MKILHFSDTHLGYSDLNILGQNGTNQREADFYDAFSKVVEEIKVIRPDYIIHTGDLFHKVSPSNMAIEFAIDKISEIDELGIPFIMIAGNHCTPKSNTSTPILGCFKIFKNVYIAYKQQYELFDEFEDVVFHCLPHINDSNKALKQIELCEKNIKSDKINIMLMHCTVGASWSMDEYGEWCYPENKEYIFEEMDYVALGHWHGFSNVGKHKNVYYSGSTERTSLNDTRNEKGFIIADIFKNQDPKVEFKNINIRPFYEFNIDCDKYEEDMDKINLNVIKDAICIVNLNNLTTTSSINIKNIDIKNRLKDALYVYIKRNLADNLDDMIDINIESSSLKEQFLEFIEKEASSDKHENEIIEKVKELFDSHEEDYNEAN